MKVEGPIIEKPNLITITGMLLFFTFCVLINKQCKKKNNQRQKLTMTGQTLAQSLCEIKAPEYRAVANI